jgi:ATP-dependent DNA helicase RecQ
MTNFQLMRMKEFCVSSRCRRAAILKYFGEDQTHQCTGCDVCIAATSSDTVPPEIHDFTADFRTVLKLLVTNKKNLTLNQIVAVLRGSKEGQKHCSSDGFGSGSSRSIKWWENVCNTMVSLQLLKMEAKSWASQGRTLSCTVLCCTPAAAAFIRDSDRSPTPLPMALVPLPPSLRTKPLNHPSAPTAAGNAIEQFFDSLSSADQKLFAALNSKRLELAQTENCPGTEIAFDSVLRGITLHKPSTLQQVRFFPVLVSGIPH